MTGGGRLSRPGGARRELLYTEGLVLGYGLGVPDGEGELLAVHLLQADGYLGG
ncbi:hypothetical protein ACIQI7_38525 [Kitasatospora sp. NPDC092039]|uniref:hypothetical protein n=1 Tax=Kitasatospora sp. NPDC092039 TaxID=3364086 RepID=UPI003830221D